MPIARPQSYTAGGVVRIPVQPKTTGDHIQLRRLGLKILQGEVAAQIGVDTTSVFNWEANTATPEIRYMPTIIRFLGYNPLPGATTLADRLVRHRTTLGMSQKLAALELGVDPGTLARWECGEREPEGESLMRVKRFFDDQEVQRLASRRAG